jgi:transposase
MYVRKTEKTGKNKVYKNYLLVESVMTPKGPRQKTVCSLGNLEPRPREEWLKLAHKVENALVGQGELFDQPDEEVEAIVRKVRRRQAEEWAASGQPRPHKGDEDLVAIHTDLVTTEKSREAGPIHVGYQFWLRLGLQEILRNVDLDEKTVRLTCAMVMNRLIMPMSEHKMPDWIRRTAMADILHVNFDKLGDHALYRNLDRLHPRRVEIESALVECERDLFNLDTTVYLYDLTSTYFEGEALLNPKARRGYSRDKRPDCKQVVVGLVVNRDGFPIAHEVLPGNTQDRTTVDQMLELLKKRVEIQPGQTVVVDRGMAFDDNIEAIKRHKQHYVIAARQCERDKWLAEFEDEEGFEDVVRQPSPRNPAQKKTRVQVKMRRRGDELHVLCISNGRKEKDRAIRKKLEKRLLADVAKLQKSIEAGRLKNEAKINERIGRIKERYPRVARYYSINYGPQQKNVSCQHNKEKENKAQTLDGSYLLKTDRLDLSAEEAWRIYILLTRAENAFRCMKSPLAERPIFHHLEHRVDTHIFLCVLAYHLLVAIEKTLLDQGVHTSWSTVRQTLASHPICTIVLPAQQGMTLKIRRAGTPEKAHLELYKLLRINPHIIRPCKTWVLEGATERSASLKNSD